MVLICDREVRRIEYYLVKLQTVTDFAFAGVLGVFFNLYQFVVLYTDYCVYADYVRLIYRILQNDSRFELKLKAC